MRACHRIFRDVAGLDGAMRDFYGRGGIVSELVGADGAKAAVGCGWRGRVQIRIRRHGLVDRRLRSIMPSVISNTRI